MQGVFIGGQKKYNTDTFVMLFALNLDHKKHTLYDQYDVHVQDTTKRPYLGWQKCVNDEDKGLKKKAWA